jgi:hypothetical protein
MVKTHPHISSPTSADLVRVAGERPFVNVYVALHELVMATLPDIVNSVDEVDAAVGYGAHQYGYNGWGMAAVTPFSKWCGTRRSRGAVHRIRDDAPCEARHPR